MALSLYCSCFAALHVVFSRLIAAQDHRLRLVDWGASGNSFMHKIAASMNSCSVLPRVLNLTGCWIGIDATGQSLHAFCLA